MQNPIHAFAQKEGAKLKASYLCKNTLFFVQTKTAMEPASHTFYRQTHFEFYSSEICYLAIQIFKLK
jgi:hypothetical protein